VAPPAVGPAAPPVPWEEALRRIISRGKPDVAAEVCREALQAAASGNPDDPGGGAGSSGSLAPVHALYAEALYAQGGNGERAAEHDRRAATGFLDAARIDRAAMLFARSLTETDARAAAALQKDALLRRLLQMARQRGEEAAVRRAFERLRGSGRPETYERLSRALSSLGKDYAEAFAPAPPEIPPVGPDELISLPAAGLAEITPRRLTAAVDAGDEAVVAAARQAIERLQARDAALAGALLSAVAALDPAAASRSPTRRRGAGRSSWTRPTSRGTTRTRSR
jgi:tetratricopeptide (TPR) repeat protein